MATLRRAAPLKPGAAPSPPHPRALDAEGDDMLAIGVADVLTPIVLAVSAEVIRYLSDSVVKETVDRTAQAARDAVRAMIRRPDASPVLDLPPGTEITVRKVVTETIISVKGAVPEDALRQITDALAGPPAGDIDRPA